MAVPRFRFGERQVLLIILGASLLAYAGSFLLASSRKKASRIEPVHQPFVRWMPPNEPARDKSLYAMADLTDPSLMSLPSVHGFSRRLWKRDANSTPNATEWNTGPAFVEASAPRQVNSLLGEASLLERIVASASRAPAEPDESITSDTNEPSFALNHTVVERFAGLDGRGIVSNPELPTIASETALRPTRVRVAVAPDGTVRFATLDRSCGNEATDAQAMDLARRIRFEPSREADSMVLSWGVLRFIWTTATPSDVPANGPHN